MIYMYINVENTANRMDRDSNGSLLIENLSQTEKTHGRIIFSSDMLDIVNVFNVSVGISLTRSYRGARPTVRDIKQCCDTSVRLSVCLSHALAQKRCMHFSAMVGYYRRLIRNRC